MKYELGDQPLVQIHLEPDGPIEIGLLTAQLGSIARQYEIFAKQQGNEAGRARLLVAGVSPGSIDINLVVDLSQVAGLLVPAINHLEVITKFVDHLRRLLSAVAARDPESVPVSLTNTDCQDIVNIAAPIANHGGTQVINIIQGDVRPIIIMNQVGAQSTIESVSRLRSKSLMGSVDSEGVLRRERVSMTWHRFGREKAKTVGTRSPDMGLITEIFPKPRAVMFEDALGYLKDQMIDDESNPMQKVYFVDVEVSSVGDRVTGYRIVGYHGSEDLD